MLPQLKHFIHLTIAATVLITTVAAAIPKVKPVPVSTKNTTKPDFVSVKVSTRYITTATTNLTTGTSKTFGLDLCEEFHHQDIRATVILHSNTYWLEQFGRLTYYIVDDLSKGEDKALCTNINQHGDAGPHCEIPDYSSEPCGTQLYLIANASKNYENRFTINIDIAAEIPTKTNLKEKKKIKVNQTCNENLHRDSQAGVDEYLTEVLTLKSSQFIDLFVPVKLNVTFCPKPGTKNYSISSTVTGTDGASSYAQFICKDEPCKFESDKVIWKNPTQLPKNELVFDPKSGGKKVQVLVLVGCMAGLEDDNAKESGIAGHFMYTGEIVYA